MRIATVILCALSMVITAAADDPRPIVLVQPGKVWQTHWIDGEPVWKSFPADVVIQGFDLGTPQPPTPDPGDTDSSDPIVAAVAALSRQQLGTAQTAAGLSGLVQAIADRSNSDTEFAELLRQSADMADSYFNAGGRVKKWVFDVLAITNESAKIVDGLRVAFALNASDLKALAAAVNADDADELPLPIKSGDTAKAVDWLAILKFIQFLISFLENMGEANPFN
jgi:hypothetical protein